MPITVPRIETQRLLLRPFEPTDLPAMVLHLNDYDVVKHTANIPYPYGIEEAEYFYHHRCCDFDEKGFGTLAVIAKENAQWMGSIALRKTAQGMPVLGYMLGQKFWGCGYMPEAARALIDFHFTKENCEEIHATVQPDNLRSSRLLLKLGFEAEGFIFQPAPARGPGDQKVLFYRLRRENWCNRE